MRLLKISGYLFLTGLLAWTTSCAYYRLQPIPASAVDAWTTPGHSLPQGYIFYQPELYFAVNTTTDKDKTVVTVTPVYLPNYRKPYRLTTHNFLAKADFAFEFENGWKLTRITDKADTAELASALAGELKTILAAAGIKSARDPNERILLFRPVFDKATGFLERFEPAGTLPVVP